MSGGRPVDRILGDNFTEVGMVANKSGRKYWKCNHCDTPHGQKIEGREQRPIIHLSDPTKCPGAPPHVHQAAHTHLMAKGSMPATASAAILPDLGNTGQSASDATSLAVTQVTQPTKKRKGASMDAYADVALTDAHKADADLKFFRYVNYFYGDASDSHSCQICCSQQ
jgi:hypothetical protein